MFKKVYNFYDKSLVKHPVVTKCLSAGVLYGAGDLVAQYGQHQVNKNENKSENIKNSKWRIDYIRFGAFCLFGTLISGPLLHHFFKHLDKVPRYLKWDFKIRRFVASKTNMLYGKASINSGYVNSFSLYKIRKWRLWTNLCIKACTDVLLFDAVYILIFYVFVGMLTGVGYKEYGRVTGDQEHMTKQISSASVKANAGGLYDEAMANTNTNTLNSVVLKSIWKEEVAPHLRAVYEETYLMDCKVWIPIQLLNFRFVPLRFQVLFTNAASLLWNVYLSLMASSIHDKESVEKC